MGRESMGSRNNVKNQIPKAMDLNAAPLPCRRREVKRAGDNKIQYNSTALVPKWNGNDPLGYRCSTCARFNKFYFYFLDSGPTVHKNTPV